MFRRHRPRALDAAETAVVAATLPHWALLEDHERDRLGRAAADLLDRCSWEAANGFTLEQSMRITIAGQAALLVVGLPDQSYRDVRTIVVHPSTIIMQGPRRGPIPGTVDDRARPVLGHTTMDGPVFIAWDVANAQARHPERGHNVVFHEFAHKLDTADGMLDGTPALGGPARARWIKVCQAEFDALRAGGGSMLLRNYAATNPSEFFAVATEVFFNRGLALRGDRPELYEVLADFYRQDPAARDVAAAGRADGPITGVGG